MNEFRQKCITDLAEALDHPLLLDRSLEDRLGIASAVAEKLFMLGWVPPAFPTEPEEWRVIPGFSAWQASNKGFVRHSVSRVWVPISVEPGGTPTLVLYDDRGRDVQLELQQVIDLTWPREGTEILFDNGSTAFIPEAESTGRSMAVILEDGPVDIDPNDISLFGVKGMKWGSKPPVPKEEWKVIPDLPTRAYEVNKTGDIRIAHNKKILPLEGFDIDYNMEVVEVRINGATYMLNGPIIARELFRD